MEHTIESSSAQSLQFKECQGGDWALMTDRKREKKKKKKEGEWNP